jgi:tripartite-type tricarboxylate transporter receptor subunit TctC
MVLAPAGTPREAIGRLSAEVTKAMSAPDLRARFEQLGIEPLGTTPEQASRYLDDEIAKWAKVITTAGVKPET